MCVCLHLCVYVLILYLRVCECICIFVHSLILNRNVCACWYCEIYIYIYSLLTLYWNSWLLDGAKTETLICFYVRKTSMFFPRELILNHLQVVFITWFTIFVTSVSIVQLFKAILMVQSFDSKHISFVCVQSSSRRHACQVIGTGEANHHLQSDCKRNIFQHCYCYVKNVAFHMYYYQQMVQSTIWNAVAYDFVFNKA